MREEVAGGQFLELFLGSYSTRSLSRGWEMEKGDVCAGRVVWPNGPAVVTSSGQGGSTRPG